MKFPKLLSYVNYIFIKETLIAVYDIQNMHYSSIAVNISLCLLRDDL